MCTCQTKYITSFSLSTTSTNSDNDSEDSCEDESSPSSTGEKSTKQKSGTRSQWAVEQLEDLIDIIITNENFKEKLIFQNTKFQRNSTIYEQILKKLKARCAERNEECKFTARQLRSKFKKLVAECKKLALTIKTASGVQNFIRERGHGAAFNQLYALVKTRDSCNPEKAVEPSASSIVNIESNNETEVSDVNCETSDTGGKEEKKQFVPVRSKKRNNKEDTLSEAIQLMKGVIENDPTRDLIELIREDMEKSRQHELRLMQMLVGMGNQQISANQQTSSHFSQQSGYSTMHASYNGYFPQDYSSLQGYQFHPTSTTVMSPPTSTLTGSSDNPVYHSF